MSSWEMTGRELNGAVTSGIWRSIQGGQVLGVIEIFHILKSVSLWASFCHLLLRSPGSSNYLHTPLPLRAFLPSVYGLCVGKSPFALGDWLPHSISPYPLWFPVWFGQWEGWTGEQRVGVKVDDRLFLPHWLSLWHHGLRWLYLSTTTAPAWSPGFKIPAIFQLWQPCFLPLLFRPGMVMAPSCRQSLGAMPVFVGPLIVPTPL